MSLAERISDAELEVMAILWREGRPVSSTDLRRELQQSKGWEKSTVLTLLRRLVDKGVVAVEKRDASFYTPNLDQDEYVASQARNMVDRLYDGNVTRLVAALCRDRGLSAADLDELKAFFAEEDD